MKPSRWRKGLLRPSAVFLAPSNTTNNNSSNASDVTSSDVERHYSSEEKAVAAAAEKAKQTGFMKRKDFDSHSFMMKTFAKSETLPSGIKVYNLPPTVSAEGDASFDQYRKTTSDYLSKVSPNTLVGVGLGAGFGSRGDKRLGWLRSRQDHLTPMPPEEEYKALLKKSETEGVQDLPEAKTPQERKEQIERLLKYMKSYDGMTLSHNDHFLLVDLDFEKDSLLFGSSREEFTKNVDKLKEVILQYNRWERTDNAYRYGTMFMKFATAWLLVDCLQTYLRFKVLRDSLDEFIVMTNETIESLKQKRLIDYEIAAKELEINPPNFAPVVATIVEERRRVREEAATKEREAQEAAAATQQALDALRGVSLPSTDAAAEASSLFGTDVLALPAVSANATPAARSSAKTLSDEDRRLSHPMDTTHEAKVKAFLEADERRKAMSQFAKKELDEAGRSKERRSAFGFVASYFRGKDARVETSDGVLVEPLSQADFVHFSYAAAPTSIATVRSVRRILLPRSDDYTQIVREEMVAYKKQKDASEEYGA